MQIQLYSKKTIESYTALKKMYFGQIRNILSEYFDKRYGKIEYSDRIDLKVSEITDILMLPFLNQGESFTLNSFLINLFEGEKAKLANFKIELNKVVMLEDLIEILTVFKMYSSGMSDTLSPGKIVSFIYFQERERTNHLIKRSQYLLGNANRVILIGDSFSSILKINEVAASRNYQRAIVKVLQEKVRSKSALINCIDLISNQMMAQKMVFCDVK